MRGNLPPDLSGGGILVLNGRVMVELNPIGGLQVEIQLDNHFFKAGVFLREHAEQVQILDSTLRNWVLLKLFNFLL